MTCDGNISNIHFLFRQILFSIWIHIYIFFTNTPYFFWKNICFYLDKYLFFHLKKYKQYTLFLQIDFAIAQFVNPPFLATVSMLGNAPHLPPGGRNPFEKLIQKSTNKILSQRKKDKAILTNFFL